MNSWLFLALLAPFLWAFTNVIDGALRRHFIKDDLTLAWVYAVARLPFVLFLFWTAGTVELPDVFTVAILLVAGLLWAVPIIFYLKAIKSEEPSRIALLLQLIPIFTVLTAYIVLGEKLTLAQWPAFLFLMAGGVLASTKHLEGKFSFHTKALLLMMLCTFMWSTSDVLFKKYAVFFENFNAAFALYMFGGFLFASLPLFLGKKRSAFFNHLKNVPGRAWILIAITVMAGLVGSFFFGRALTLGKASLTTALMGAQPLFVFILGLLCAPFIPEFYKEAKDKTSLALKGLSLILIVTGLFFL